jgi:nicotinamidase-related amidase
MDGATCVQGDQHLMEEIVRAAHLCVDMQNIFAKGGLWETPWMERVLPTIEALVSRHRERTVFSRFITPRHPEDRPGNGDPIFAVGKKRRGFAFRPMNSIWCRR